MPTCFRGRKGAKVNHRVKTQEGKVEPCGQLQPEGTCGVKCPLNAPIFSSRLEEDILIARTFMAFVMVASL